MQFPLMQPRELKVSILYKKSWHGVQECVLRVFSVMVGLQTTGLSTEVSSY